MYQKRVTSTPRSVPAIRSAIVALPPSMITLPGRARRLLAHASPPRSASRTGSSARRSRPRRSCLIGRPSSSKRDRSARADARDRSRCRTLSPTICSPTRLPPPFFEKKLRPSSACRASAANSRKTSRSASAAGSRTTVYLPGSIAAGFCDRRGLVDRGRRERAGLEQPQLVERLRRPARPGAVRRARRQVVVGGGEPVVGEEPLRRRHRLHLRRCVSTKPGRHDVLLLAQRRSPSRTDDARQSGVAFAASSKYAFIGA